VTPWLRATAAAVLVTFTLSACSGNGTPTGVDRLASLVGSPANGPYAGRIYYHHNHLNSTSVISNQAGQVTYVSYLPFGEISQANSTGSLVVTRKFTGQEMDDESGLYYYGARYFNPAIGRFISADTVIPGVTNAQAFNKYAYAANNPVLYTDPTGHAFEFIGDVVRAVGAALSAVFAAVGRVGDWLATTVLSSVPIVGRAMTIAADMIKAMAANPMAVASFLFSAAMTVSGLCPPALGLWFKATALSISATSMATAAGVSDPTVLGILGATAGALGAGAQTFMEFFKTWASWGVNKVLERLEGAKVALWLAPLNAIASSQVVNRVFGKTNWVFTKDGAIDPDAKGGAPESVHSTYSQGSRQFQSEDTGSGYVLQRDIGYSGHGEGLNNRFLQYQPDVGPLPQGEWSVGAGYRSSLGNPTFVLEHQSSMVNQMRTLIRIHGDNRQANFTASTGCLILSQSARVTLQRYGPGSLTVTY